MSCQNSQRLVHLKFRKPRSENVKHVKLPRVTLFGLFVGCEVCGRRRPSFQIFVFCVRLKVLPESSTPSVAAICGFLHSLFLLWPASVLKSGPSMALNTHVWFYVLSADLPLEICSFCVPFPFAVSFLSTYKSTRLIRDSVATTSSCYVIVMTSTVTKILLYL